MIKRDLSREQNYLSMILFNHHYVASLPNKIKFKSKIINFAHNLLIKYSYSNDVLIDNYNIEDFIT